jgi:hypothetical protein
MLKMRKRRGNDMMLCNECDIEMDTHRFNGKQYYNCGKCGKEIVIENSNETIEDTNEDTNINEMSEDTKNEDLNTEKNKEYLNEESSVTLKEEEEHINEECNRKQKIRNILTPDVRACQTCINEYNVEITCSKCSIIMLKPDYNGRVYECPICQKLYCESCWNKIE